jgi:hypothetical protein
MVRTQLLLALCLALVAASCVLAADQLAPVQKAIDRLAQKLNVPAADIRVASVEGVDWGDTSLGAPQPGMMYAQVITPGYKVMLEAKGRRYEYHTDMNQRAVLARVDGAKVTDQPTQPTPAISPADAQAADRCRADLARRLSLPAAEITVARVAAVEFPDASLGLPEPGQGYAQVITPGCVVILKARNTEYLYTTAGPTCRYGGPLAALQLSAVGLQRIPNEPNMNGNLVQVSLAGANPQIIMSAVTGYWPQANGSVVGARRTSRSGFDLLYMAPGKYGESIKLASAFYFGEAAVNSEGSRWAAYSRPQVGGGWQVSWGETTQAPAGNPVEALTGGGNRLGLPEGATPGRMYWHLTNPVAVLREGERLTPYELILNDGTPRWQKFGGFFVPPTEEYMLNKSETLMVKTEQVDGRPVTSVVRRWFTGDEKPVGKLVNFTPDEMSLANRRFLVLSGKRGEQVMGFTVDIATGEVLETVKQSDGPVRLLQAPPQGWIYSHLPTGMKLLGPG